MEKNIESWYLYNTSNTTNFRATNPFVVLKLCLGVILIPNPDGHQNNKYIIIMYCSVV